MTRLHKPPSFRATSSMCTEAVSKLSQQVAAELGMRMEYQRELVPTNTRLAYHSTMVERIKALEPQMLKLNREFFECQINYHEKRVTHLVVGIMSGKNVVIRGS